MMNYKVRRTWICKTAAVSLAMCILLSTGAAAAGKTFSDRIGYQTNAPEEASLFSPHYYSAYLDDMTAQGVQNAEGSDLPVDLWSYGEVVGEAPKKQEVQGEKDVLVWGDDCKRLSWNIQIPKSGFYELWFDYFAYEGNGLPVIRGVMIDGEYLYDEAMNFTLNRFWKDKGKPITNILNDQLLPAPVSYTHLTLPTKRIV